MPTIILNQKAILKLLDMAEVIGVVEAAFKDWAEGRGTMPPKAYLLLEKGDFRAMPASLPGAAGVKWVAVHPQNPGRGLPTVMGTIIYNDPQNGYPLAIMDGTDITAYRTGAAAAIASKYLARPDARTLGIIGAGRQAHTQIQAHLPLFNIKQVKVFDTHKEATVRLIKAFPEYPLRESTLEETAAADIVCTLTPSREPYLKKEWIAPGTHINAIGADAEGKEELEPALLKRAMVVVDDIRQASVAGEINVPVAKKLFSVDEVYANLGEIIAGKKRGRTDPKAITIFDSTGVAIEDIAVTKIIYEKALKNGNFMTINMIGTAP
ncbi:MAG: ornithine cyclodeaminase family protein [Chloroflexi bacterium RBG_16_56_11]|nr:MAG: ornithine cyclodeaminase family protein [Chloroflexi bacterium RBG_16_56_11]